MGEPAWAVEHQPMTAAANTGRPGDITASRQPLLADFVRTLEGMREAGWLATALAPATGEDTRPHAAATGVPEESP